MPNAKLFKTISPEELVVAEIGPTVTPLYRYDTSKTLFAGNPEIIIEPEPPLCVGCIVVKIGISTIVKLAV